MNRKEGKDQIDGLVEVLKTSIKVSIVRANRQFADKIDNILMNMYRDKENGSTKFKKKGLKPKRKCEEFICISELPSTLKKQSEKESDFKLLPPKFAVTILGIILPLKDHEMVFGDLEESYHYVYKSDGPIAAKWFYWSHVVRSTIYILYMRISQAVKLAKKFIGRGG